MRRLILALLITLLATPPIVTMRCLADTLDTGGVKYNGTFNSFDKAIFTFTTGSRKTKKEQPTRVKRLLFDKPVGIRFRTSSDKSARTGTLKKYEMSHFHIEIDGKDEKVHYMKMNELVPYSAPSSTTTLGTTPSAGTARHGSGYPIPKVNTTALASQNLTDSQRSALNSFRTSKTAYDNFMRTSSALVQEMDTATGPRREKLLDELRIRKNKEQPFKNSLTASYKELQTRMAGQSLNPRTTQRAAPVVKRQPKKDPVQKEIVFEQIVLEEPDPDFDLDLDLDDTLDDPPESIEL